jgi:hypothetical protein
MTLKRRIDRLERVSPAFYSDVSEIMLAYLAPEVLKRLVYGQEVSAVTVMQLSECAGLPWVEQAAVIFEYQS